MSGALDLLAAMLLVAGVAMLCLGTVGLLRFPDTVSRLHALTKADNVGLGLVVAGLAVADPVPGVAIELLAIWLLAMLGGATAAHLVARAASETPGAGVPPGAGERQ